MRGTARRAGLIGVAAASLLAAAPAAAEVTVTPSFTILEVSGDAADDRIAVDCERDRVTVNGAPAVGGRARCRNLEELEIRGRGGDDRISIDGLRRSFEDLFEDDGLEVTIDAGPGDDRVAILSPLPADVSLESGDDRLTAAAGSGAFGSGGTGDDWLIAGSEGFGSGLYGGPGADRITGGGSFAFFLGGPGPDRIRGLRGTAVAFGGAGEDAVTGGPGPDLLSGGRGDDFLAGQNGRDLLAGARGRDRIFGGYAGDLLTGGMGRDRLSGGPGKDLEFQRHARGDLRPFDGSILGLFFLNPGLLGDEAGSEEVFRRSYSALLERRHRQAR